MAFADLTSGVRGNSIVVTGAAGGIGSAVAELAAQMGATVVAVDRPGVDFAGLRTALSAANSSNSGGKEGRGKKLLSADHQFISADLTDLKTHTDFFDRAREVAPAGGQFSGLVHAAAIMRRRNNVMDITEDDWDQQNNVNLRASFFLNRTAWQAFESQGCGGSIVNFASQGWWTGGFGGSVAYAATKGGIVSMTRGLAGSFAPSVRVNALAPGGISTEMYHAGLDEAGHQAFLKQIPLGRLGDPAEIAGPALFLISDAASYMTGTVLNVSGGQLSY